MLWLEPVVRLLWDDLVVKCGVSAQDCIILIMCISWMTCRAVHGTRVPHGSNTTGHWPFDPQANCSPVWGSTELLLHDYHHALPSGSTRIYEILSTQSYTDTVDHLGASLRGGRGKWRMACITIVVLKYSIMSLDSFHTWVIYMLDEVSWRLPPLMVVIHRTTVIYCM